MFHVYCSQVTLYKGYPLDYQNRKKPGEQKSQFDIFTKTT